MYANILVGKVTALAGGRLNGLLSKLLEWMGHTPETVMTNSIQENLRTRSKMNKNVFFLIAAFEVHQHKETDVNPDQFQFP